MIYYFDKFNQDLELESQKNQLNAAELFNVFNMMYKAADYRCLKPHSNKNPDKWEFYSTVEFKAAATNKQFETVPSLKYDNNFNNWIDPSVLENYVSSEKSAEKSWKNSYGFPIIHFAQSNVLWSGDGTEFLKDCAKWVF